MQAFIALMFVAAATASIAPLYENSEPIPGSYIIKLHDEFNVDEMASTVRLSGGKVGFLFRRVLHGFAAELSDEILDIVLRLPAVEYVEQNGVYRTQTTWGLDRVDQTSLPLDNIYLPRGTGEGAVIYIVDTGVYAGHEEFGDRAEQLKDFTLRNNNVDCNGHGTHCAGTAGGLQYGVAPGAKIRGVKVLNCVGSGSTDGIVAGLDYVASLCTGQSNCVASMSLGGGASTSLDDAVNNLVAGGVPTAVAAGNSNEDAGNTSPARASGATTVGATDNNDNRSSFSNYGSVVNVFAPGTGITAAWNDGGYNTISGTSMATPHVAGGMAIFNCNSSDMLAACTVDEVKDNKDSANMLLYVGSN